MLSLYPLRCFFFSDTPTTAIYTLSLHDALPISGQLAKRIARRAQRRIDLARPKYQQRRGHLRSQQCVTGALRPRIETCRGWRVVRLERFAIGAIRPVPNAAAADMNVRNSAFERTLDRAINTQRRRGVAAEAFGRVVFTPAQVRL